MCTRVAAPPSFARADTENRLALCSERVDDIFVTIGRLPLRAAMVGPFRFAIREKPV
jgi:hypothetical protein